MLHSPTSALLQFGNLFCFFSGTFHWNFPQSSTVTEIFVPTAPQPRNVAVAVSVFEPQFVAAGGKKKKHLPSIWRRSHINGRIYSVLMAAPTAHESWMGAWLSVPAGALRVGGAGAAAPPHSHLIYCWSSIGSVVCCSLLFSSRNAVVDISMAIMSAAPSAGPLQTLWKFWEAWEGQTAG